MADENVLNNWRHKWEINHTPWHRDTSFSNFMEHIDKLLNGRSSIQVFFPMCGKCLDMKWFYDQGHQVVGVEYCEKAILEFFAEQKLVFKVEDMERVNGKLYKTTDDRLKLFCCDIFKFDVKCAGLMDAVWDRGALSAVEKEDRKRYIELVTSLLAVGCRYLLSVVVYNDWFFSGCPRSVPDELVHFLYDKDFLVNQLKRIQRFPRKSHPKLDVDVMEEVIWLFVLKEHND